MTSAPILFLDIDNVLNSDASCRAAWPGHIVVDPAEAKIIAAATLDPVFVARVQRICDATGADVVIASGWRTWMSREEITAALRGAGLTAPVVDVLGGVKMRADLRCSVALAWLKAHPSVTQWVAIDDTASHWPRGQYGWPVERLVVPVDGISEADVVKAVAILSGTQESAVISLC